MQGTMPGTTTENGSSTRALVLATLSLAASFIVWGLFAPLAPTFRDLYGLSGTQTGFLVALPVVLGSLARIPLGLAADLYGGRRVFTLLMLFLLVPLALAGFTRSFAQLLAVAFFLGLAGASFAVGVPFVARWYTAERQGMALGIYGMGNIGTAIAGFTAPFIAARMGWPAAFRLFLPLVGAMAVIFWLLARDAPGPRPQGTVAERLSPLRRPMAWVLSFFYFVTFGGFVALSVYLPTFLVDAYGLERGDAALRAAGFGALATLARPLGGGLSDRFGALPLVNTGFLIVCLLAILLAFLPGMPILTVGFLGIAVALGLGNGAVFKLVPTLFPKETGAVTGLVGAAGGVGGFFPPIVMGLVRDITGSYAIGLMLLSEFALVALIVNLLVLQQGTAFLREER